jgi:outer membrane usher protein
VISLPKSSFGAGSRPRLEKPFLVAPVVLDDVVVGDVWLFPRSTRETFAVESETLLQIFKPVLKPEFLQSLARRQSPQGTLSLRDIDAIGASVDFDENALKLVLKIPLKLRPKQEIELNYVEIGNHSYLKPFQQSGYLNLWANQPYQYSTTNSPDQRLPLSGRTELVENIGGYVLETSADYQEDAASPLTRQDTSISKDFEEQMLRATAGDLIVPARGFQLSPQLAGFSLSREFGIQPYRLFRPLSTTEIEIKRVSIVEIYVNGVLFSQMRLNPGRFNIRDFSLATGQNNVRVKIRDDLGQEETADFSVFYENNILEKGVEEFSYNLGVPWTVAGPDRAYDSQSPSISAFHRWGITDQWVGGLNFQNYLGHSLTGAETSVIGNWGYLSLDIAATDNLSSSGQLLRYRSLDRMFGQDMRNLLQVELERLDSDFAAPSAPLPLYSNRVDAQLTRRFSNTITGGLGGTYEIGIGPVTDQRGFRMNLLLSSSPWSRWDITYSKTVTSFVDDRLFVSFYWSDSTARYAVNGSLDTDTQNTNLGVQRNNLYAYNDYRASASVDNSPTSSHVNATGEYLAQGGVFRATEDSTASQGLTSNTLTLGVDTGIAWVGHHAAFTQPVTDSFVLVDATGLSPDQSLIINPVGDGHGEGQLGPRASTVLRNYASYYRNQVNLDSTSLPMGAQLEPEYYFVQPTYRSGILIPVKIVVKVVVKGQLFSETGLPIALVAGDILNARGELVDNTFFTTKNGDFFLEGLEPGDYKIITNQPDLDPIDIRVADTGTHRMDTGRIVVKRSKP